VSDEPHRPETYSTTTEAAEANDGAASLGELRPVAEVERISSIDVLRGFALLGLLSLNLPAFLPFWNPLTEGGTTSLNVAAWSVNSLLDGTMRCLFSMLFGAGVILLTQRAESRGRGADIGDVYYRRILWLLLFGVVHCYILIWPLDILYIYAAAGLFLFPLRRLSPRTLIVVGTIVLAVYVPVVIVWQSKSNQVRLKAVEAAERAGAGKDLSDEQSEAKRNWKNQSRVDPDPDEIQTSIDRVRSGYWANFRSNASVGTMVQSTGLYLGIWDAAGMMLLGMAFVKMGVFSATRSNRFYIWLTVIGYGVGLPWRSCKAYYYLSHNFDQAHYLESWGHVVFNPATYEILRLFVAAGHVGILTLLYKSDWLPWFVSSLAAVGRMALTNYVLQSVIVTLLFNGYGLGLYGHVQRYQTFFVVFVVCTFQLCVSPLWLKHFRFGPVEWLWRSLTYWTPQPMLVERKPVAAPAPV
jgi:uncharacterized protein